MAAKVWCLPVGCTPPDGSKASIKSPTNIHHWMIAYVPGVNGFDAKSFECAIKDAAVGLSKPFSLRNENIVN